MRGIARAQTTPRAAFEGLPEELSEFLQKDTYSLLIKGGSGTGKTILALRILKSLSPIDNLLYISTRTSPLQLVENYPWAEDVFGPADTSKVDKGKESGGWETLVDARLDEPSIVFERITNVLMDKEAPTVVIDSWESLSDALGSEALRTNIKVLQTWRERAGARFIFVGEDPANNAIDFMVEGVVVLKEEVDEGRRLRKIVLSKLHGVQISRPSYLFTLQGGTFSCFPHYSPADYEFKNPMPVRFDRPFRRSKRRTPTGYPLLDDHLEGGFPQGSEVLIEIDRKVDFRAGLIFLSRTIQDWLLGGGRVVMQRLPDLDRKYLNQFSKSFQPEKGEFLIDRGANNSRAPAPKGGKKTMAVLLSADLTGNRPLKGAAPDVTIRLQREDRSGSSYFVPSVHLKMLEEEGTLFVVCDVPSSAQFAVFPSMAGGNPMMQLERVV